MEITKRVLLRMLWGHVCALNGAVRFYATK